MQTNRFNPNYTASLKSRGGLSTSKQESSRTDAQRNLRATISAISELETTTCAVPQNGYMCTDIIRSLSFDRSSKIFNPSSMLGRFKAFSPYQGTLVPHL